MAPPLRGILLDVDGTLYHAAPVRIGMVLRLGLAFARSPRQARRVVRAVVAYRRAQESLRARDGACDDLDAEQLRVAAGGCGLPADFVAASVRTWFEAKPLPLLRWARRRGLLAFLAAAAKHSVPVAAVSDYPVEAKLNALGVRRHFRAVVSAQDREVRRFKPDPTALRVALARLGVEPQEALHVGDRPEVDGVAAARAGVPCVVLGRRRPAPDEAWVRCRSFPALQRHLGW